MKGEVYPERNIFHKWMGPPTAVACASSGRLTAAGHGTTPPRDPDWSSLMAETKLCPNCGREAGMFWSTVYGQCYGGIDCLRIALAHEKAARGVADARAAKLLEALRKVQNGHEPQATAAEAIRKAEEP